MDPVEALRAMPNPRCRRWPGREARAEVMFRPEDVAEAMADVVRWRTMQAVGRHGLAA
jgi:hypothetical protein